MRPDVMEIVKAPHKNYRYAGYLRSYSIQSLQQALDYLEEENKERTQHRRRAIWYEIQRREKLARIQGVPVEDIIDVVEQNKYLDRAPNKTSELADDWNVTCQDIYQKIQYMPDIPIIAR